MINLFLYNLNFRSYADGRHGLIFYMDAAGHIHSLTVVKTNGAVTKTG